MLARKQIIVLLSVLHHVIWIAHGFLLPTTTTTTPHHYYLSGATTKTTFLRHPSVPRITTSRLYNNNDEGREKDLMEFMTDPFPTRIPKEMKDEIYRAEGNTAAAKERTQRITVYGVFGVVLVGIALLNAFLTELRTDMMDPNAEMAYLGSLPEGAPKTLDEAGFGWVESNALFEFLFLNKLGGGGALITGAVLGLLAEAEFDTRRTNAEKIWEEIERRQKGGSPERRKKKKKRSGKERKRLEALSEVLMQDTTTDTTVKVEAIAEEEEVQQSAKEEDEGIMGKVKGFFEKADSMAASQALLLNKELEDKGVLDKITDETGLKVIGREAAAEEEKEQAAKEDKKEKQE